MVFGSPLPCFFITVKHGPQQFLWEGEQGNLDTLAGKYPAIQKKRFFWFFSRGRAAQASWHPSRCRPARFSRQPASRLPAGDSPSAGSAALYPRRPPPERAESAGAAAAGGFPPPAPAAFPQTAASETGPGARPSSSRPGEKKTTAGQLLPTPAEASAAPQPSRPTPGRPVPRSPAGQWPRAPRTPAGAAPPPPSPPQRRARPAPPLPPPPAAPAAPRPRRRCRRRPARSSRAAAAAAGGCEPAAVRGPPGAAAACGGPLVGGEERGRTDGRTRVWGRRRRQQRQEFPRQLEVAAAAPPPRVPVRSRETPRAPSLLTNTHTKGRAGDASGAGMGDKKSPTR